MKKIPYGITNYKDLILEDYYYVDKTMYLEKLEDVSDTIVYLRPRRFGKTLFTSMLYYYYDVNSKDLYDDLFKSTYIYNHPTKNKNNYYILKFDFSGMGYREKMEEIENNFNHSVKCSIIEFLNKYDLSIDLDYNERAADLLKSLMVNLKLDHKIYVIIDEYDNFTNSILSNNQDIFKKIHGTDDFIKDFYARIKEYTGTVIDRVFITGVCSISLDSMTSGFNIATNITNNSTFNSMTALTHEEVKELLKEVPDSEKHYNTMLEYYDGYKFDDEGEKVFNPTLTMYYLKSIEDTGKEPKVMLDSNIISNYEQIKNIISLGNYKEILDDIYDNGEISSTLTVNFDLNSHFEKNDIISLLYYFGYLTVKDVDIVGIYQFKIPNRVIKKVFSDYYMNILKEYNILTASNKEEEFIKELLYEGKIDKFCSYISSLLKMADNRIYINFKEKDLQIIMYTILTKYLKIKVELEYRSGDHYIDMAILKNEVSNYNILIELKYIKEKEKDTYDEVYRIAKEQILKYTLNDINEKKYIVIFTGSNYTLEEV